jgi:tRNA-specific 2-thiouridylase
LPESVFREKDQETVLRGEVFAPHYEALTGKGVQSFSEGERSSVSSPETKESVKAISLFSGGLDSIVSVKLIQEQGIDVQGLTFCTPFFEAEKPRTAARMIGLPLMVLDITEVHLAVVRAPRYGYGKNMNPCIDCHTLMLKIAGEKMREMGCDFIFTGEVLGQRPMSQSRQMLHVVAKNSGWADYILRPLSARLLPETLPEKEGKVDRARLLDISGRGRKRQMEMAERYGITEYANPAGGCLLTDPMFSRRLKNLFTSQPGFTPRDLELLKVGRHIRLNDRHKVIVGRNKGDNQSLEPLIEDRDAVFQMRDFPGPLCMLPGGGSEEMEREAAAICAAYGDAPKDASEVTVKCRRGGEMRLIVTKPANKEELQARMI